MKTMATRGAEDTRVRVGLGTDFHVHVSQKTTAKIKPIDFSEERLKWMHALEKDPQKKLLLSAMLVDYKIGAIAISWKMGEPTYLRVTKER